jgi:hypothetical protein
VQFLRFCRPGEPGNACGVGFAPLVDCRERSHGTSHQNHKIFPDCSVLFTRKPLHLTVRFTTFKFFTSLPFAFVLFTHKVVPARKEPFNFTS